MGQSAGGGLCPAGWVAEGITDDPYADQAEKRSFLHVATAQGSRNRERRRGGGGAWLVRGVAAAAALASHPLLAPPEFPCRDSPLLLQFSPRPTPGTHLHRGSGRGSRRSAAGCSTPAAGSSRHPRAPTQRLLAPSRRGKGAHWEEGSPRAAQAPAAPTSSSPSGCPCSRAFLPASPRSSACSAQLQGEAAAAPQPGEPPSFKPRQGGGGRRGGETLARVGSQPINREFK